ncbi:MAG TPA: 4Fe-4S dicluster domain-containing protein [Firmicutes bacterium]|nr:4Fe-4S dicluster domain-containing protein [Bacillota bacterium]
MSEVRRFFVDRRKCLGCKTCELRCAVERGSVSKALAAAVREAVLPRSRVYVQSDGGVPSVLHCRQCDDAPCLSACSTGALKMDPETGVKYIDADKCISCWMCVMSCPYGAIAPAAERHAADKCDQCYQMEQPYCMAACPTGAIELLTEEETEARLRELREAAANE